MQIGSIDDFALNKRPEDFTAGELISNFLMACTYIEDIRKDVKELKKQNAKKSIKPENESTIGNITKEQAKEIIFKQWQEYVKRVNLTDGDLTEVKKAYIMALDALSILDVNVEKIKRDINRMETIESDGEIYVRRDTILDIIDHNTI